MEGCRKKLFYDDLHESSPNNGFVVHDTSLNFNNLNLDKTIKGSISKGFNTPSKKIIKKSVGDKIATNNLIIKDNCGFITPKKSINTFRNNDYTYDTPILKTTPSENDSTPKLSNEINKDKESPFYCAPDIDSMLKKREYSELPSTELENTKYLSSTNSWIHNQICSFTINENYLYSVKNLIQDKGSLNSVLESLLTTKGLSKSVMSKLIKIFKPQNLLFLSSVMIKNDK